MDESNNEVLELSSGSDGGEVGRKHLFSIKGTKYYVIDKPRPNIGLKMAWNLKTKGVEEAQAIFLIDMIGDEGFQALMNYDDLTEDQLTWVVEKAQEIAFGTSEKAKNG